MLSRSIAAVLINCLDYQHYLCIPTVLNIDVFYILYNLLIVTIIVNLVETAKMKIICHQMVTNTVSNSVSHGALLRPKIGQINVGADLPGVQPVLWNVCVHNTFLTLITELIISFFYETK